MTNSEAIKILEEVKTVDDSIYQYNQEYTKALDMAIKALEQQEKLKDFFMKDCESCKVHSNDFFNFDSEIIKRNDCISREDAIKTIQQYGVGSYDFENYTPEQAERFVIQRLSELPPVGKDINVSTIDCVSRKEAINCLTKFKNDCEETSIYTISGFETSINCIKELQSVKLATMWHKVEDGLPKENGEYVVVIYDKRAKEYDNDIAHYDLVTGWDYVSWVRVVAWMPLPRWEE